MRRVCALHDIEDGGCLGVEAEGETILLRRRGDRVAAFEGRCPHAGAPLAEGALGADADRPFVVCPFHHAVYELDDGARRAGPGVGDLRRYAVEVIDGEVRVGEAETEVGKPRPDPFSPLVAIVGAGAAGLACAVSLRRFGHEGRIVLIDAEPDPLYDRTTLSKFVLEGDAAPAETARIDPARLDALAVETRFGERVAKILPTDRTIRFESGETLAYESCFAAPGAAPRRIGLPGEDLPGVHQLRSAEDAMALRSAAKEAGRATVIGGGFIGMEASAALAAAGVETTLLVRESAPGARFGEDVAEMLGGLLREAGVRIRADAEPEAFVRSDASDRLASIRLKTGGAVDTPLALVAVGEARRGAGLVAGLDPLDDGALPVDANLAAAPGLWIGGDVKAAEAPGGRRRTRHWRAAEEDGRAAAAAMTGRARPAEAVPFFWSKIGAPLHMLGEIDLSAETHDEGEVAARDFTRYYLRDRVVIGALGTGSRDVTHRVHAVWLSKPGPWRLDALLEATGRG